LFFWDLDVFDSGFWDVLGNVLSQIFDCVVVSDGHFSWDGLDFSFFLVFSNFSGLGDSFHSGLILVFDHFLLEGDIFNSAFSLDDLFSGVDCGVDNLLVTSNEAGSGGISSSNVVRGSNGGGVLGGGSNCVVSYGGSD
jgi:hypothetical protein